jgi:hypothetical protein
MSEWTEGLNDVQKTFVTDKGFENVGALVDMASQPPTSNWMETITPEQKGFVESKGFANPGAVVDSYKNLESLKGVPEERLLKLPEKSYADDPEAWAPVFAKMGRPENAEGYDVTPFDTDDASEAKVLEWAKTTFHKLNMSKAQGEGFIKEWNEMNMAKRTEMDEEANTKNFDLERALRTKWGLGYEKNRNTAVQAYKHFKLDDATFAKIEGVMGGTGAMEFFHSIGVAVGEGKFIQGAAGADFKSPEQANFELSQLSNDTEFMKKFAKGDSEALRKHSDLIKMANPEHAAG